MERIGLAPADLCTLVAYFVGITILGLWISRTVRNTTDFFVGGRRFGKLFSTFLNFGAGTHSDQAVSLTAKVYTTGLSGIWYQWLYLFATPFYWLIYAMLRRCRAISSADYFEVRFGRSVAMLFVIIGMLNLMVTIGTMLKGSGALITATTGGKLSEEMVIALVTVVFVVYGMAGGLVAAVVTDFVQGMLTIVFSFLLLPFALREVGGFSGLQEGVRRVFAEHGAPGVSSAEAMWSIVAPPDSEITLFYVAVLTFNALVGVVGQPSGIPTSNASRTDRDAQIGAVTGTIMKRICSISWCLLAMCAFVIFPGMTAKEDIDRAFGMLAHKLLPQVAPGLIGVFTASLLASIMAACDAFMISCSGLFTHNLYRPLTGGRKSERHYVNVGRAAAGACVLGGVAFAYEFESVLRGLELFWKISALMGIAFWAGLFWRRANAAGAWAGTLGAFAVLLATSDIQLGGRLIWSFNARLADDLPAFMLWKGQLALHWQMLAYLAAGCAGVVIGSLLGRRPDAARLDRFYGVLRTPVSPGEVITAPFTLPAGVAPPPSRKLIDHRDWEIQVPSRRSVIGFLVTLLSSFLLVGVLYVIARIGA